MSIHFNRLMRKCNKIIQPGKLATETKAEYRMRCLRLDFKNNPELYTAARDEEFRLFAVELAKEFEKPLG